MGRHEHSTDPLRQSPEAISEVDVDSPNSARMYDHYLGGSANFAVDRTEAERVLEAFPAMGRWARANRSFLGRAVASLSERGIDQFLDLGSGIPTIGNVHEIAHRHNPHARIAYVDCEPVAVAHARRLLSDEDRVSITQADIRDPHHVLAAPGVSELLDFNRPVAVLAVAVLHALPETDQPARLMADYRKVCAPGSALVLTHGVRTTLTDEQYERFLASYRNTPTPATFRTVDQVAALLDGYQLLDPGLVPLDQWRPESPVDEATAIETNCYAAVGNLPGEPDHP
ncbi:trans-aconitate methyltransferase [Saccharopolyspora lacisalsi]|uniref:Trans-aconitate methyltransferase n=1 Tax=Halosaccharopolyspora lacisalsi TaxID=1000566 RepID=A0A839DZ14_9PSEU|nr:SAM-dependent methyltransferase [Halosaccharopolyspora lacisalsi]MBA8826100.1 trans-aconitate methyltransferase [Halosaccharopolyspora lacisalsi]